MFALVGGCVWLEKGSIPSSKSGDERSNSGEGDILSRALASISSSSDAADDRDGEIILAAVGPFPASAGIGCAGQVVRK